MHKLLVLLALVSCARPSEPRITSFADERKIFQWFVAHCDLPRFLTVVSDTSLPQGMHDMTVFRCQLAIGEGLDVQVQYRGAETTVCAVSIGPTAISKPVDLGFVADWFEDKALGKRVKESVSGPYPPPAFRRMSMVEGIRVAVVQNTMPLGTHFFLSVDGCGHVEEWSRLSSIH